LKQPIKTHQETQKKSSSRYVVDLNELFKAGQIVSTEGFEQEVEILEKTLAREPVAGTILVDRNATKRVPVVQNLAAYLVSDDVAPGLRGKRIVKIDLPSIFTDSKTTAEVSAHLDSAFKQVEATNGRAILFVEDISGFVKDNPAFGTVVANRFANR
jgi:ATP-dependent Clp protease ATP-binding subunit ClpB